MMIGMDSKAWNNISMRLTHFLDHVPIFLPSNSQDKTMISDRQAYYKRIKVQFCI